MVRLLIIIVSVDQYGFVVHWTAKKTYFNHLHIANWIGVSFQISWANKKYFYNFIMGNPCCCSNLQTGVKAIAIFSIIRALCLATWNIIEVGRFFIFINAPEHRSIFTKSQGNFCLIFTLQFLNTKWQNMLSLISDGDNIVCILCHHDPTPVLRFGCSPITSGTKCKLQNAMHIANFTSF